MIGHREILQEHLMKMLELNKNLFKKVLEIGAGDNSLEEVVRYYNEGCEYKTIDNGAQYNNMSNEEMDAHKLSFPDNSFDLVIMSHTAEHFENPSIAFKEILRVIKQPGLVISITPKDCEHQILKGDTDHWFVLNSHQWIRLLTNVGFKKVRSYVQMTYGNGMISKEQDYNIFTTGVKE